MTVIAAYQKTQPGSHCRSRYHADLYRRCDRCRRGARMDGLRAATLWANWSESLLPATGLARIIAGDSLHRV
jgi:hypothetical protein